MCRCRTLSSLAYLVLILFWKLPTSASTAIAAAVKMGDTAARRPPEATSTRPSPPPPLSSSPPPPPPSSPPREDDYAAYQAAIASDRHAAAGAVPDYDDDDDDEQDEAAAVGSDDFDYAPHERASLPLGATHLFEHGETRGVLEMLKRVRYDHRQYPESADGSAVNIRVSVVVSNIRAVSEATMDYSLELFYREAWLDPRLRYNASDFREKHEIALHESYTNFLWRPDTFMPNAVASKNPTRHSISHRSLLRLRETGEILHSRRLSIVAECPMDLTLFPFDTQLCKLGIESYGYTADQVRYSWSNGSIRALDLLKIRLPDFEIAQAYVTSRIEEYATGNYSRLYICFVFSRSSGFCFLQLIIPSTAVVITSWVSLWMEDETEFQDMISIILAITFLIFSYNEMMPHVAYIKAMDIYLGVCFMIVFLSLIKLAFIKYMSAKIRLHDAELASRNSTLTSGVQIARPRLVYTNGLGSLNRRRVSAMLVAEREAEDVFNRTLNSYVRLKRNSPKSSWMLRLVPTKEALRRFHSWTQIASLVGFCAFCLFYFAVYPRLHAAPADPDCRIETAEASAFVL